MISAAANARPKRAGGQPPSPVVFYRQALTEFYMRAFSALDGALIAPLLPDDTQEVIPLSMLSASVKDREIYYNPMPKAIRPVLELLMEIHNRIIGDLDAARAEFIDEIGAMPEPRTPCLLRAKDSRNFIASSLTAHGALDAELLARAISAMLRVAKGLAEAMFFGAIMGGKFTAKRDYLPYLCIAASAPARVLQIARTIRARLDERAQAIKERKAARAEEDAPADDEGADTDVDANED